MFDVQSYIHTSPPSLKFMYSVSELETYEPKNWRVLTREYDVLRGEVTDNWSPPDLPNAQQCATEKKH